jgi:hypothetical protein
MTDSLAPQTLEFKEDFEGAKQHWLAFWQQEIIDRPCCSIRAPRDGAGPAPWPHYMAGAREDFGPIIERVLESTATVYHAGEAMPNYVPSFGPDQMAAWLGCELEFEAAEFGTNWAVPCVDDWESALPITLDPENYWWKRSLAFMEALGGACAGKLLIAHLDLHSNADTLVAMRLPAKLCMDFYDCPELVDRAMADVRALYAPIYEGLYDAARMGEYGTLGWVQAYHPVRTNTIQCDFAALIGKEHFRRFVLPALEEEAAYLGHCCYHLDGPECLIHLDDLCAIDGLDCIQWTTGARNAAFIEWMDLLKEIQAKGTSLWVPCNTEGIRIYHRELDPTRVWYDCYAPSEKAADETLRWLVENT